MNRLVLLLIGAFVALQLAACSPKTTAVTTQNTSQEKEEAIDYEPNDEGNYVLVEEMPRFPGCEDLEGSIAEKKNCADQELLKFIYQNVSYPDLARENGVEGMSVVSFTVSEKGKITDIKILRDPGSGTGAEAMRVVALMNDLKERWTPGKVNGEKVRVQYNLPIRFKLNNPKKAPLKEGPKKGNSDIKRS